MHDNKIKADAKIFLNENYLKKLLKDPKLWMLIVSYALLEEL
jgi:hypothetical protein